MHQVVWCVQLLRAKRQSPHCCWPTHSVQGTQSEGLLRRQTHTTPSTGERHALCAAWHHGECSCQCPARCCWNTPILLLLRRISVFY